MNEFSKVNKWYCNKLNKNESEFDEFDAYVCRMIKEYEIEALILPVVVKPLNASFKTGDKVKFARRKCVVKFFNEKSKLYDLEEEETEKGYFNVPLWFITKSV